VDLYGLLGIGLEATGAEVRKAFLKKALETHPDKNLDLDPKVAEANFIQVQRANEILSDDSSRESYNVQYFRWLRNGKVDPSTRESCGNDGRKPSQPTAPETNRSRANSKRTHSEHQRGSTSKSRDRESHDWKRYRRDKANVDRDKEKARERRAAMNAAREEVKRRRAEAAKARVEELYCEHVGVDGSQLSRSVRLVWKFPHKRPATKSRIRRLFSKPSYGYHVQSIRMQKSQSAVVVLGSPQEANDLIHGREDRPCRNEFGATWSLI